MNYKIVIDGIAQDDIDDFYGHLCRYSEATALKYVDAFHDTLELTIAIAPHRFAYFLETGAPYRALLFSVSGRTSYWIIYRVDDLHRQVRILRFWHTARKPGTHGL